MSSDAIAAKLAEDGAVLVERLLEPETVEHLAQSLDVHLPVSRAPGARNLLAHPAVRKISECPAICEVVTACLSKVARPIKATLFDKSPEMNWLVAWHQDPALPFENRIDVPGWTTWSIKDGLHHAHPPVEVLERVLAVRIHLDDVDASNGPLRVALGTHKLGRISTASAAEIAGRHEQISFAGSKGTAVLMSPLVLHASSKATSEARRRVLHLEYSDARLPPGLAWPTPG